MTLTKAIVRPPGPGFAAGLTMSGLGRPLLEKALSQHRDYCRALEDCGLAVTTLEADARYPDSTFVEDTAVLTGRCAVLARPGAASRQGEVAGVARELARHYTSLRTIEPPGTVDGGDVCFAGDRFFIGLSGRTNEDGARQLADLFAREGLASVLVDVRGLAGVLHIKSALSYLGGDRLAATDGLAGRPEFSGYSVLRVDRAERYAANCVRINEHVLVAAGHPRFEAAVRALGHEVIALEMSEFQKMDGGLSCLSLRF